MAETGEAGAASAKAAMRDAAKTSAEPRTIGAARLTLSGTRIITHPQNVVREDNGPAGDALPPALTSARGGIMADAVGQFTARARPGP